jgi:hypothetical protein
VRWQILRRSESVSSSSLHNSSILIKNTASQNDTTVKHLKLGLFLPTLISLIFRLIFRRSSLPPSKGSIAIYIATFLPAFFLSNYLIKIGQPRRDPTTGTLISYGEDLSQRGVTEWCFDILYITCWSLPLLSRALAKTLIGTCQIGSGAFGEWFWWLYMVVSSKLSSNQPSLTLHRYHSMPFSSYGHLSYRLWY